MNETHEKGRQKCQKKKQRILTLKTIEKNS